MEWISWTLKVCIILGCLVFVEETQILCILVVWWYPSDSGMWVFLRICSPGIQTCNQHSWYKSLCHNYSQLLYQCCRRKWCPSSSRVCRKLGIPAWRQDQEWIQWRQTSAVSLMGPRSCTSCCAYNISMVAYYLVVSFSCIQLKALVNKIPGVATAVPNMKNVDPEQYKQPKVVSLITNQAMVIIIIIHMHAKSIQLKSILNAESYA